MYVPCSVHSIKIPLVKMGTSECIRSSEMDSRASGQNLTHKVTVEGTKGEGFEARPASPLKFPRINAQLSTLSFSPPSPHFPPP